MSDELISELQYWIDRLQDGDPATRAKARQELIHWTYDQLVRLTHNMLRDYGRVKRWEDTEDVCHEAVLRLMEALQAAPPCSLQHFFRLAALQIRRELIDLARHYYGPEGLGANHATNPGTEGTFGSPVPEAGVDTHDPSRLAEWTELHRQIEALPAKEREVVELLLYCGWKPDQAAALLQISKDAVKKRWLSARLKLREALGDRLPGL